MNRSLLMKLYLIYFFGYLIFLSLFKIKNPDLWLHLKTGEYIVENHTLPKKDIFSFTAQPRDWLNHEWLSEVIFNLIERTGGLEGLQLFKIFLLVIIYLLIFLTLRDKAPFLGISLLLISASASRSRFLISPDLFTYLMLSFYFFFFYRPKRVNRAKYFILLPFLQMIWTNIHGGYLLGLMFLLIHLTAELLCQIHQPFSLRFFAHQSNIKTLVFSLLLSILAISLNPLGLKIFSATLEHLTVNQDFIREWRPMGLKMFLEFRNLEVVALELLLILGLLTVFLIISRLLRKGIASGTGEVPGPKEGIIDLGLIILFSIMALKAQRFTTLFAIFTLPPIIKNFPMPQGQLLLLRLCPIILLILSLVIPFNQHQRKLYTFGFGIEDFFPAQAISFIKSQGLRGKAFNSYGLGGYLIWNLYPNVKVFIDGRLLMYGVDFYQRFYRQSHLPAIWNYLEKVHDIDMVILGNRDFGRHQIISVLDTRPDWVLVYWDRNSRVYLKTVKKFKPIIEKFGFRYIKLSKKFAIFEDSTAQKEIYAEIKKSLALDNTNDRAHLLLGYYYLRIRPDYRRALMAFQAAAFYSQGEPDTVRILEQVKKMGRLTAP